MKRSLFVMMGVAVLSMAAASTASAQEQPASDEAATACQASFTSGNGEERLAWCVSNTANLMQFESPAGFEHIRIGAFVEGYAVCATGLANKWDSAETGSGWGPSTVIKNKPYTLRRISTDGAFQLDTAFKEDKKERDITVTMTLTNRTALTLTNVQIARYVDFDTDNNTSNIYDRTNDSISGRSAHGMVLNALTVKQPHATAVETFATLSTTSRALCAPASIASPTASGDFAGHVWYNVGNIKAGKKVIVNFVYRRI